MEKSINRVAGLNTMRAILAFVVVLHHLPSWAFPPEKLSTQIYRFLTFGPAAVIGFFVISGFCIHWGSYGEFSLKRFYARRYIRITVPLVGAIAFAYLLDVPFSPLKGAVTWSLVCEEIYYFVYPYFRTVLIPRYGLARCVAGAYLVGIPVLIISSIYYPDWTGLVPLFAMSVGYFAAWLCGGLLAELVKSGRLAGVSRAFGRIHPIILRGGLLTAAGLLSLVKPNYQIALPVLGFFFFVWLMIEVGQNSLQGIPFLESMGEWSYSLYLTHVFWLSLIVRVMHEIATSHSIHLTSGPLPLAVTAGLVLIALTLASAYLFYLIFEKPSHQWARTVFSGSKAPPSFARVSPLR